MLSLFWVSYCEIPEVLRSPCGMEARLALLAELAKAACSVPVSPAPPLRCRAEAAPFSPQCRLCSTCREPSVSSSVIGWKDTGHASPWLRTSTLRSVFLTVLVNRLQRSFKNRGARKFANHFRQPWVSNTAKKKKSFILYKAALKFKIPDLDILAMILF